MLKEQSLAQSDKTIYSNSENLITLVFPQFSDIATPVGREKSEIMPLFPPAAAAAYQVPVAPSTILGIPVSVSSFAQPS